MAAAAASVTTPRIPAHETTADSRADRESKAGRWLPRRRRLSNRAVAKMYAGRTRITVTRTASGQHEPVPQPLVGGDDVADDPRQLHADEREREGLQQEVDRRPDAAPRRAAWRTRPAARCARGRARRSRPRARPEPELLGAPVRGERGEQADRGGDHRVVEAHPDRLDDEPDGQTDRDPHDDGEREDARAPCPAPTAPVATPAIATLYRVSEVRVVDQALAREQRHHPPGQPEAADGRRGDCVRRRDDGPEREGGEQRDRRPGRATQ